MRDFCVIPICTSILFVLPYIGLNAQEKSPTSNYGLKLNMVRSLDESAPEERDPGNTYLTAFRMRGSPDEKIELIDSAEVRRGGAVLRGDTITYTFASDEVRSIGNALVARNGTVFKGPELTYHLDAETGFMPKATFSYLPNSLRGTSDSVELLGNGKAQMCNAIITTCRPGEEAWWIKMETLDLDELDETASGKNASLYLGSIPVLASPYFTFPIADKRTSGFLTPRFAMSSTVGVNFEIPFYWNIAPNYDYTITPKPMTKRGLMVGNEFRYLQPSFGGEVTYDILFKDKETHEKRYSLSWKHFQQLGEGGPTFGIDYQKVSDNNFLSDFSTNIRESSEDILPQNFWLSFGRTYWSTSIGVYKNQTLRPDNHWTEQPYEKEPEFNLSAYVADFYGLSMSSRLTATRFRAGDNDGIGRSASGNGNRVMLNSSVSYPLMGSFWHLTPKVDYMMTWYDNIHGARKDLDIKSHASRMLPIFSIDSGLVFERSTEVNGRLTEQTLEPRVFYAYIPYRDQNRLPNFDSSESDLNFAELFSPNKFTGYDRVSNANQLSATLTTRYIDSGTGQEWFSATVGQRYYFEDQKVGLYWETPHNSSMRSDVLAATQFTLFQGVRAELSAQYSNEWSRFSKTTAGIRYNPKEHSVVSLYYRYNYNPYDNREAYYNSNLKQVDFSFQWPIQKDLYALGRYNYSIRDKKGIESLFGLEYRAGCWILRGAVQRYVRSGNRTTTNFFLELELLGLGSVGASPIEALSQGITGYRPIGPRPIEVGRYDYYE